MAFASAITKTSVFGDQRIAMGIFTQVSGDVGGDVITGLTEIVCFQMTAELTNVSVSGGTATVVIEDPVGDQAGFWIAIGD